MLIRFSWALLATVLSVLPANAQSLPAIATTTADLNMRTGPGTTYAVIITVPRGGSVTLLGCTATFSWCDAAFADAKGWVSGKYLIYGGSGIYHGQPIPAAGINLGLPRYHRDYTIYAAGSVHTASPVYKGGPVYKGDPAPVPGQPPELFQPPVQQPYLYDPTLYPFATEPCPRYPDRYFEHQVC